MIDPIFLEFSDQPLELIPKLMVYRNYDPETEVTTVRMVIQRQPRDFIRRILGASISRQTINRWINLFEETQRVIDDPETDEQQGRPYLLSEQDPQFMGDRVELVSDLFLDEIEERSMHDSDQLVGITTIQETVVNRLNATLETDDTFKIGRSLLQKFEFIDSMMRAPAECLVFVDETSICSRDFLQKISRSRRGRHAVRYRIEQNPVQYNLLPAISYFGVLAVTVTKRNITQNDFYHFLKSKLLPRMNPYPGVKSVLVMDNASIHQGPRIERLCRERGVILVYHPPNCTEINPIELCFRKIKSNLKRRQCLPFSREPLWVIQETTYNVVTPSLCRHIYRNCNYEISKSEFAREDDDSDTSEGNYTDSSSSSDSISESSSGSSLESSSHSTSQSSSNSMSQSSFDLVSETSSNSMSHSGSNMVSETSSDSSISVDSPSRITATTSSGRDY